MSNPYADEALTYLEAGWSPIPLPYARKSPPPAGVTGYSGTYVNRRMARSYSKLGRRNVAVRAAETVIGIDVDAYKEAGDETFAEAQERLGELPATFRSSARTDGISGIYWFRVPAGRRWADKVGPGVEIVHHGHRYAVVAPSLHPDGMEYEWFDEMGIPMSGVPHVDELPELPEAWADELDAGSVDDVDPKALVSDVEGWLEELPGGEPCQAVQRVLDQALAALTEESASRHDETRSSQLRLTRLGEQGHHGVLGALQAVEEAFLGSVGSDRGRGEAAAEWDRALLGAVAIASARLTPDEDRGCCPDRERA